MVVGSLTLGLSNLGFLFLSFPKYQGTSYFNLVKGLRNLEILDRCGSRDRGCAVHLCTSISNMLNELNESTLGLELKQFKPSEQVEKPEKRRRTA